MNQTQNIPSAPSGFSAAGAGNDDLLALIRAVRLLWKHRWWIALGTFVFTAAGIAYALLATPVYVSEAIFTPKQSNNDSRIMGAAGVLSQLGDMGGMLASQMGLGTTTLDQIAIVAQSHDIAEAVVSRHNLLPLLFHKDYDLKTTNGKPEIRSNPLDQARRPGAFDQSHCRYHGPEKERRHHAGQPL